jgi:broad specificity phosphatase PhoE
MSEILPAMDKSIIHPTHISLVRHGQVANPANIYYGRLPGFALSAEGEAQALAAGRYLRPLGVNAIYHSPMLRARQTATLISSQLEKSITPRVHEDLSEVYSRYDGTANAEMARIDWDLYSSAGQPYERPADVIARVISFLRWAQATHQGEHVVGVTHGDLVAFALVWVCGLAIEPATRRLLERFGIPESYPATGSVTTFTFGEQIAPDHCSFGYWHPP